MAVCRTLFTDEEHAALQATVSTTQLRTIRCYTLQKKTSAGRSLSDSRALLGRKTI